MLYKFTSSLTQSPVNFEGRDRPKHESSDHKCQVEGSFEVLETSKHMHRKGYNHSEKGKLFKY